MPTFIDLFSGCGGLSLGLLQSGWDGVFAIEKSPHAFATLKHNLIGGKFSFAWPSWLPAKEMTTNELLTSHSDRLKDLQGTIDLIAGGPPCQGFSFAGRRNHDDPRNQLSEEYIEVVKLVKPKFLLLENVRGFTFGFKKDVGNAHVRTEPYSNKIVSKLQELDYVVYSKMVECSDFGVPQSRTRFLLLAVYKDHPLSTHNPFDTLYEKMQEFRVEKGLPAQGAITVQMAIGDLEKAGNELVDCLDSDVPGFKQIRYVPSKIDNSYIRAIRKGMNGESPNSLRLPNHRPPTLERFKDILDTCRRGVVISMQDRERLGIKKVALTPLHPNMVSKAVTTLPDDMLHYSEPRILTVRETARLQTFPDWFAFQGKYTTGALNRKKECPRYTQVGNAVPPMVAEAIGKTLAELAGKA